jgi:hypothetical protein
MSLWDALTRALDIANDGLNEYVCGWDAVTGTDLFSDYLEEGGDAVHGSFAEWLKKWPDTGTYPVRMGDE